MLERLNYYLTKIEASIVEGEKLVATRDPELAGRIRQRCVDAAVLIGAYQLFVHRELFEPMMRDGDELQRRTVCDLKIECIALTRDLQSSVKAFATSEEPLDWLALATRSNGFNHLIRVHLSRVRALTASVPGQPAGVRAA